MCCSPSWSDNKEAVYGDLVTFSEVKRDAKINRLSDLSGGESSGWSGKVFGKEGRGIGLLHKH